MVAVIAKATADDSQTSAQGFQGQEVIKDGTLQMTVYTLKLLLGLLIKNKRDKINVVVKDGMVVGFTFDDKKEK